MLGGCGCCLFACSLKLLYTLERGHDIAVVCSASGIMRLEKIVP